MANEYLIQNTTLTAIANAIRGKLGESNYTLNEGLLGLEEGTLITPAVVSYVEFVDYNGGYDGVQTDDGAPDSFGWYGYIADNNGVNTLVLYKNDPGSGYQGADTLEPFFHIGRAEIDGAEYDKWRKIELGDNKEFLWDSAAKKYIYTNVITEAPTDAIGPLDMPAKIMSISGGEDLSAELAAQDELIADIKTAVAGKAGGGGGVYGLTIHANGATGTQCMIPYIDDNGDYKVCSGYETLWGDHNFQVPKGAVILLTGFSFTFNYGAENLILAENAGGGYFSTPEYNEVFYVMAGDVEITIG